MNHIDEIVWRPGFNDPEPIGWIAFAAYGLASVLCFRAALCRADSPPARQSKRAWFLIGLALGFLGLNLQLDLHTFFFQWGRQIAETQGWYEKRRSFQKGFMAIFSITLIAGAFIAARRFRTFVKTQKLAVAGVLLVTAYVLARNAAFNHFDDREGSVWEMKDALCLVELAGVTAIGFAAWRYSRSGKDW